MNILWYNISTSRICGLLWFTLTTLGIICITIFKKSFWKIFLSNDFNTASLFVKMNTFNVCYVCFHVFRFVASAHYEEILWPIKAKLSCSKITSTTTVSQQIEKRQILKQYHSLKCVFLTRMSLQKCILGLSKLRDNDGKSVTNT